MRAGAEAAAGVVGFGAGADVTVAGAAPGAALEGGGSAGNAGVAEEGFAGVAGEGAEAAEAKVAAAAHECEPGVEVDAQTVEGRGEVGGDGCALVAALDAAGLVYQDQVVVERDDGDEGAAVGLVDGGAAVQPLQM